MDVIQLTKDLVAIESESQHTTRPVADFLETVLRACDFQVERVVYWDENGVEKVNLVARKGEGTGGLGLFSHMDTVPGGVGWSPFTPAVEGDRLVGRGSCDMKGPLAATIVAASRFAPTALKRPLVIAVTADEEIGHTGAHHIVEESALLTRSWPDYAVVAEPTSLVPVYAHKGGARITVTAYGVAAHTSTDRGESANFKIAPFLAEMAELAQMFRQEPRFMNREFDPPTNGFNMVLDDGGTPANVTAAKTVCTLGVRAMPNAASDEAIQLIVERAQAHGLEVEQRGFEPFYVDPSASIVQAACRATGADRAITVPYGTEAVTYQRFMQTVVLGPGDIAQAHTIGEWIALEQLHRAVEVYTRLIQDLCCQ